MLERMYGITPPEEFAPPEIETPDLAIKIEELGEVYGRFVAEPLERGWSVTLGNPLRRALLSSLEGTAITWVRIEGVLHEYTTIEHMREEVGEFLLNVKGIRLRSLVDRTGRLRLEVDGEGEVRAGDIMATADFDIVNPEHHLATLDSPQARLSVEFNVEQGSGYVPAAHDEGLPIGVLPVDSVFTPIRKANFRTERTRIGQRSDLERLVLEVWTDRTITPLEAVRKASNLLIEKFYLFSTLEQEPEDDESVGFPPGVSHEVYNMLIETLDLSARTLNCLKRADVNRVGEVLSMSKEDLLAIRNFGQKSLDELYGTLRAHGILESGEEPEAGEGPEAGEEPEPGDGQDESEELAAVQAASGDSGDET